MNRKHLLLATASAVVITLVWDPQVASAQALEEIIVTARKREENLMEVPLAITAFSSQDIEAANVKQMTDLVGFTPSFYFVNQTGGGSGRNDRSTNSLTFRGLFAPNNQGTAAGGLLFIDGAPVLNAQAPSLSEIERVEVLKGPQSAYFGRSTFAGAINFVTRDPDLNEFRGRVSAEYSSYNSHEEQLGLEGPIVPGIFAVRLSLRNYHRGGHYVNAANRNERLGEQNTKSIAGQFIFAPSDALRVKGFVNVFEDKDGPPAQMALKRTEFNCFAGGRTLPAGSRNPNYWCGNIPNVDEIDRNLISGIYTMEPFVYDILINNVRRQPVVFDPKFLQEGGLRRKDVQSDIRIDYTFAGGYSLSALTAYHRDKVQNIIDLGFRSGLDVPNQFFPTFGGLTYTRWQIVTQALAEDYSQELRLTSPDDQRFRFTVGGNYINLFSPGGTVYGLGTLAPGGVGFFGAVVKSRVSTPSVFGGLYYDIVDDTLTLSAEARYQWDKITQRTVVAANGLPPTGAAANAISDTFKSFSPRVSLDYKYAPDSTLYALWSRGYRPGGFNAILFTSPPSVVAQFASFGAQPSYREEKLDNFEAGIKGTFMEGRARATLSAYYDKYTGGQVSNTIAFTNPNGSLNLASAIVNTGKIDLKGVELEADFQVTEQLTLSGSLAHNDTDIKVFQSADSTQVRGFADVAGNSTPIAPKWTWSATAEFADDLTDTYQWFTRVDYQHVGRYFTDFSNVAYGGQRDLVNMRIGIRNEALTLEAFGTNLLQDATPPSAFIGNDVFTGAATNEIRLSLPLKRTFGVRARYNF